MHERFGAAATVQLKLKLIRRPVLLLESLLMNRYGAIQADASSDQTARDAVAVPVFHTRQLSHDCPPIIRPRAS